MTLMLLPDISQSIHDSMSHMFGLQLPIIEKLVRPILVYLSLVVLLRLFGKRELANLNPFDLVVLLSLSNTVQNAIIGDDNTVSGGIIGAISLLGINWLIANTLYRHPKWTRVVEGKSTVLIRDGELDPKAMQRESLTEDELISAVHRQGFTHLKDVAICQLEPTGNFYVEGHEPDMSERQHAELLRRLDQLTSEIAALRSATS